MLGVEGNCYRLTERYNFVLGSVPRLNNPGSGVLYPPLLYPPMRKSVLTQDTPVHQQERLPMVIH